MITNDTLISSLEGLRDLGAKDLPIKTSFKIAQIMVKVNVAAKAFDIAREKLVEKYGAKREDGSLDLKPNGQIPLLDGIGYQRDLNELLALDSELDIASFSLSELGDISVKASTLASLHWLITEQPA